MKKFILIVLLTTILPFNVIGQMYPDEDCPSNIYLFCSDHHNKFYIHLFVDESGWRNIPQNKNEIISMRLGEKNKIRPGTHYCKSEPKGSVIRLTSEENYINYDGGVINRETGRYQPDSDTWYHDMSCKESSKKDFDHEKKRILESIKKQKEHDEEQKKIKEKKKKF